MTTPCVRGSSLKDAMHPPGEPSDTKVANSTTIGIFAVTILAVSAKALSGGGAISAEGFVDPATGIAFSPSEGKLGLMGVGVRVKKLGPVAVKVYSVGFYTDTSAVSKAVNAKAGTESFYGEIAGARAEKALHLKFARGVGTDKVADALASVAGVPAKALTQFGTLLRDAIGADGIRTGETITLRWPAGSASLSVDVRGKRAGVVKDASLPAGGFTMFLGSGSVSPALRKSIAARYS